MNHTKRHTIESLLDQTRKSIEVPSRDQFREMIPAPVTFSPPMRYTGYGSQIHAWFHKLTRPMLVSAVVGIVVLVVVMIPQQGMDTLSTDQMILADEGQQALLVIDQEDVYTDQLITRYVNQVVSAAEFY